MTISSTAALFVAMVILALIPGPGIFIVVSRTIQAGIKHGISTTAGIVSGDFIFIALSLLGLAALSEMAGDLFNIIKYMGALYLVYLGVSLLKKHDELKNNPTILTKPKHLTSYLAGLITTLSNPKAILFYLSFFPAFFDPKNVYFVDVLVIYTVTCIAVGGVMMIYALVTHKAKLNLMDTDKNRLLRYFSALLLIGSGVYIAARS